MVTVAAIDCGSNSTRLLISDVQDGKLQNLYKQHVVTRLSDNVDTTNVISEDSKKRFIKVKLSISFHVLLRSCIRSSVHHIQSITCSFHFMYLNLINTISFIYPINS